MAWSRGLRRLAAMRNWISRLRELAHGEAGVTAIEYGLLAALIAIAIISAIGAVGSEHGGIWAFWTSEVINAIRGVL